MLQVYRRDNYELAGKNLSLEETNSFVSSLRTPHPLSLPLTDEQQLDLEAMLSCYRQFTQDLGVHIDYRFPATHDFVTILPPADFAIVSRRYGHHPSRISGFTRGPRIYVKAKKSKARVASVVNHELAHFLGYTRYRLFDLRSSALTLQDVAQKRSGYAFRLPQRRLFYEFNEGLTELTHQQIKREYWSSHRRLQHYSLVSTSNYRLPVLFDQALFTSLASDLGKPVEEVVRRFQRGYFLGNERPLHLIKRAYGEQNFSVIAHLPREEWEFVQTLRKTSLWDILR
ncbi:hypothetical protein HYT55_04035 [Candidatus Woesearchaeota archaeon]|nr:hypothetical protein [Candidatus Woesearchaeota archaeon]